MSVATGRSIGMEMGEWLGETLSAAEHMTGLLAQVRQAPRRAVEDIENFTSTLAAFERVRKDALAVPSNGSARRAAEPHARPARSSPPSSNTGGKGPKTRQAGAGK
jgi:hypothetical protein